MGTEKKFGQHPEPNVPHVISSESEKPQISRSNKRLPAEVYNYTPMQANRFKTEINNE